MVKATTIERVQFSLSQATSMLPLLRLIVADIQLAHRELSERRLELHRLMRRRDGKSSRFHDDELEETRSDIATEARQLDAFIDELEKLGVKLRSAEEGIVDFPTMINGQSLVYSWKLGELAIEHWHQTDETYSDRKHLDLVNRSQDS